MIATAIGFVIGLAIGVAILVGLSLGIVYAFMWLLGDLLGLPYVAASSTCFAIFTVFLVFGAIGQVFKAENKLAGLGGGLIYLAIGPLTYAAAFRAHAAWTGADISNGGRYLPGEYWGVVETGAGWIADRLAGVVPALGGVFNAIENSELLTQVLSSAVVAIVTFLLHRFFGARAAAR